MENKRDFDSLFGKVSPTMVRCEDGSLQPDRSHPSVIAMLDAIRACREQGDSDEVILFHMLRGIHAGLKAIGEMDAT
jgi:hypothetical protein